MRIRSFIIAAFIITLSISAIAQSESIAIAPNKVVYKRTGSKVPNYKKTFEVIYPKFSGVRNDAVKARLQKTLSYWKNFDTTLKENIGEYHWLTNLSYEVNYNKNSFLEIELIMEGAGAYPSQTVKTLVVNLNTGNRVYVADLFTNIGKLLVKIDKAQKSRDQKSYCRIKKDP